MRLVYLTVAWLAGIWLAQLGWSAGLTGCDAPRWPAGVLIAALLLAALALRTRKTVVAVATCSLMLVLGAWRYQSHPFASCAGPGDLAFYHQDANATTPATVEGVIVGFPDVRDTGTMYRVAVDRVTIAGQARPVRGKVLIQAPREPAWRYGDRLRASGLLQEPPVFADFDYRAYLAREGIASMLRRARCQRLGEGQGSQFWAAIYGVRERGAALIDRSLPEPAAALANGMLLGIEGGIPDSLDQAFKDTGTSHIVVISGSNIALLAGLLFAIGQRWPGRRRAAWPVASILILYVLLVGGSAAPLRAGIMAVVAILAIVFGRQNTAVVALAASVLIMTASNPLILWDVGFQLSALATLGLVEFSRPLQAAFGARLAAHLPAGPAGGAARLIVDAAAVTLAAQLTTLPLIVSYFGRASLIALFANILILPAQGPILGSGCAMLAAGALWPPLARLVAPVPWLFLTYTTEVIRRLARLPLTAVTVAAWSQELGLLCYATLAAIFLWRQARNARPSWWSRYVPRLTSRQAAAGIALVAAPALFLTASLSSRPDGRLHVYFLGSEAAEATLIVTPGGRSALLWDGTGSEGAVAAAARRVLPAGQRQPDLLLGTARSWPQAPALDPATLATGQAVLLDADVTMERLAGSTGPAYLLQYGEFRALLPPIRDGQLAPGRLGGGVTVVKVASGSPEMPALAAARPALMLWPEEMEHPPDAFASMPGARLANVPTGTIAEVYSDGHQFSVRALSPSGIR